MSRFSGVLRDTKASELIRKAVRRPGAALATLGRIAQGDWERLAFGAPDRARAARRELAESGLLDRLQAELGAAFAELSGQTVRGRPVVAGDMRRLHAEMLWMLVRLRRPALVVETGVCNGLSSAVILDAMDRNGHGELISVDLPEFTDPALNETEVWEGKGGAAIPAGRAVGWLAPKALHGRWTLELGRSQDLLPKIMQGRLCDVFIHDSEHSHANQMFEFNFGYGVLQPGGLLVATDINWSTAFEEFSRALRETKGVKVAYADQSCALVGKPGSP